MSIQKIKLNPPNIAASRTLSAIVWWIMQYSTLEKYTHNGDISGQQADRWPHLAIDSDNATDQSHAP